MTESERLSVEVAQFLQHLHDIAEVIAERSRGSSAGDAEALLDRELVALALTARRLAERSEEPDLVAKLGFNISAVIRTRVAALLGRVSGA